MEQEWSTPYVPPPVSQLLQYPVEDQIDDIEKGLCTPDDENVFLISSIAFLQKQLMRKMENDHEFVEKKNMDRKYSDLLIVEAGHKTKREKYFIRLPNIEKFDEVLRSEACIPSKTLSNTQILPLPKKTKSPKLVISNIFKHKSNSIIGSPTPKRSYSLFNVFRKSNSGPLATNKISYADIRATNIDDDFPFDGVLINKSEKKFINPDYAINAFSEVSSSTASSSQNKTNELLNQIIYKQEDESDASSKCYSSHSNISFKSKTLSEAEEEILRIIPSESMELKKSINQNLRVPKDKQAEMEPSQATIDFIMKDDDYYEDVESGIKFKCVPKITSPRITKVKEQQSKLSVCIEEETESDLETYQQERRYPYNCTDDVKAMVSSETIDLIMHELLHHLENNDN